MKRSWTILLVVLSLGQACNTGKLIANNMVSTMEAIRQAFFSEESTRHAQVSAPALLLQLDGLIRNSPENEELLYYGSSMNCGYAMSFLDESDPEWSKYEWKKGLGYALRALALVDEELGDAVGEGDEKRIEELLREVEPEDVRHVFWAGACWGGLINITMDETLAADLPIVELLIGRALELDPTYYFASGHLFFGMLYAGRSEMLGGDLERGKKHFEEAIRLMDGKFLLTKLFFAKSYAVNKQDAALYVKLLNEVVNDSSQAPAEMWMANNVARRSAARLLNSVGDFFPGYTGAGTVDPDVQPFEEDDGEDLDLD